MLSAVYTLFHPLFLYCFTDPLYIRNLLIVRTHFLNSFVKAFFPFINDTYVFFVIISIIMTSRYLFFDIEIEKKNITYDIMSFMYQITVPINNVSLRAFLFLQDTRNSKKEFSNTTVCDYALDYYKQYFNGYKDSRSFRSGYAGNFSLLFDSNERQNGGINKNTKTIPRRLKETIKKLTNIKIVFEEGYCCISHIPDEESCRL